MTQNWDDVALLDLVTIRSGQVDPREAPYCDMPLIAPDHIAPATGRLIKSESASAQRAISGKYLVQPGDVVYSKIRPYLQKAYRSKSAALCSADMYPLTPRTGVDSSFILHTVLGHDFTNFAVSVSARSGIPKINREEIAEFRLLAPPPIEQRAIGNALDEADKLTETLERLVAKKQAIQQGIAQELLTGRTRLPGFVREWSPVRLGDDGDTYGGLAGKVKSDFGTGAAQYVTFMEVISGARLLGRNLGRVRVRSGEHQTSVRRGDVLFNGSSETPEEVALSALVDFDPAPLTYLNSFCFGYRLKFRGRIDPAYLAYYFRSAAGREIVSVLAQGATRYNIAKTKLMQAEPLLPPLEEQQAIVNVLRDADTELERLAARLRKARAVQHGMVQQLLTGRVRLPLEAAT